jgi:hypothetical protein
MDAQQAIFLQIYRRFHEAGIEFAQPLSIVRLADPALAGTLRRDGKSAPPGPSFH